MTTQPTATDRQPSRTPLALLGGTFDPPHIGHLFLAECARLQFNAQTVLFLPAGDPYKKTRSPESSVLGPSP
ncbi:MAG: adenylyltransferase/cytidyltransferase family protein, partial [Anaerolineaceae bacterium]